MYRCEKCGHSLIWKYPIGWYCSYCGPTQIYTTNHTEIGEIKYDSNTYCSNQGTSP